MPKLSTHTKKNIHSKEPELTDHPRSLINQKNSVNPILAYQQNIGNQAVQHLLSTGIIQPKLKISSPNDKYEQEADRVAEHVMQMPELSKNLQVSPAKIELKSNHNSAAKNITTDIDSQIKSLTGSGQPLSKDKLNFFEPRFGQNFSHVRIHDCKKATDLANSLEAKAFTIGNSIILGEGSNDMVIAHELGHTLQQSNQKKSGFDSMSLIQRFTESQSQLMSLFPAKKPIAKNYKNSFTVFIFFAQNQVFLDKFNWEALDGIALFLSLIPNALIRVDGHASTEGGLDYNQKLSERRRNYVIIGLQSYSMFTSAVSGEVFGETKPFIEETNDGLEKKRQMNRRAEISVIWTPEKKKEPILYPPKLGSDKKKNKNDITTGEVTSTPESTYKQAEERLKQLRNNPFIKHFLEPTLESIFKKKIIGPQIKIEF